MWSNSEVLALAALVFLAGAVLGVFGNQVYWMGIFDDLVNPDTFKEDDAPR